MDSSNVNLVVKVSLRCLDRIPTPNEEGKGFEFENAIVGGVVPSGIHPRSRKGLQESMANGVLAGYPMVDVKA